MKAELGAGFSSEPNTNSNTKQSVNLNAPLSTTPSTKLSTNLLYINAEQQAHDVGRDLLARLAKSNQYPCFVLAPRRCGQEELLKAFALHHRQPVQLNIYEVTQSGTSRIVRKPMLSEFLPYSEEERAEIREEGTSPCRLAHLGEAPMLQELQTSPSCRPARLGEAQMLQDLQAEEGSINSNLERLALFTFIPWLDDDAAKRLSDDIDELLVRGLRVVVFCPVQNDCYKNLQSDRIEITARELKEAGYFAPQAYAECLKRFVGEFLPLKIRLAAMLAAILGRCTLDELASLNYEFSPDIPQLLQELHPLFTSLDDAGIKSEPVCLELMQHDISELIGEYLLTEGLQANTSVLASRITQLSIVLLERGDLETSHQILEIAEALIKKEAYGERTAGAVAGAVAGAPTGAVSARPLSAALDVTEGSTTYFAHSMRPSAPPLSVKLFGKLEVCHDGVPLHNKHLSRSKIRRFLAFLVLNQPRIVSRESLVEYLWPYLDPVRAQKNLYTSWFMLARGLGSERVRDCPYLLRDGEVYQLNSELIRSDTEQFDSLVRTVLFGQFNRDVHVQNLHDIESIYRDSLVADIPVDTFIETKMAAYRSKMVDVLLFETRQLRAAGELERALFCVQSAFELDETREDVFRELMDTQFEAGQRTLAMQTYFSCKQYLAEELGILPSKRTTALYQDLLLDNCH